MILLTDGLRNRQVHERRSIYSKIRLVTREINVNEENESIKRLIPCQEISLLIEY